MCLSEACCLLSPVRCIFTAKTMIKTDIRGPAAWLILNRPEKRNALNALLVKTLLEQLDALEHHPELRVVVLTGEGNAFSAGADLAALQQLQHATPEENLQDSRLLAALFARIYTYPLPVIARVNGHAIAGGCGLAAVCDFALAVETAKMGFTEVRIGFVPAIVSFFVRRKVGETTARALFLRGHLFSAREAEAMGLIYRALPDLETLDEAVEALVHELARETSRTALSLTKQLLSSIPTMGLQEAMDYATQLNALARGTADCQAGIRAFLQKQPPPWKASD